MTLVAESEKFHQHNPMMVSDQHKTYQIQLDRTQNKSENSNIWVSVIEYNGKLDNR